MVRTTCVADGHDSGDSTTHGGITCQLHCMGYSTLISLPIVVVANPFAFAHASDPVTIILKLLPPCPRLQSMRVLQSLNTLSAAKL